MKFNFPLQKVLDLKEKNKEHEEYKFIQLLREVSEEEQKLNNLFQSKVSLEETVINGQAKGVLISELYQTHQFISHMNYLINQQQNLLNQLYETADIKKEEIKELKKEVKTWENLREKRKQEFIKRINQEEQKELDDMASLRSFR